MQIASEPPGPCGFAAIFCSLAARVSAREGSGAGRQAMDGSAQGLGAAYSAGAAMPAPGRELPHQGWCFGAGRGRGWAAQNLPMLSQSRGEVGAVQSLGTGRAGMKVALPPGMELPKTSPFPLGDTQGPCCLCASTVLLAHLSTKGAGAFYSLQQRRGGSRPCQPCTPQTGSASPGSSCRGSAPAPLTYFIGSGKKL